MNESWMNESWMIESWMNKSWMNESWMNESWMNESSKSATEWYLKSCRGWKNNIWESKFCRIVRKARDTALDPALDDNVVCEVTARWIWEGKNEKDNTLSIKQQSATRPKKVSEYKVKPKTNLEMMRLFETHFADPIQRGHINFSFFSCGIKPLRSP